MKKAGKGYPRGSFLKRCGVCNEEKVVFRRVVVAGKWRATRIISPNRTVWSEDTCPPCRPLKKKAPPKPQVDLELLGEVKAPEPRKRPCHNCGNLTINRFNCTACLTGLVAGVGEAEFFEMGCIRG